MIARNARVVWLRERAALVDGSQGQPLCRQGVMWDISAEKAADESGT
jgi:hypothetical protein